MNLGYIYRIVLVAVLGIGFILGVVYASNSYLNGQKSQSKTAVEVDCNKLSVIKHEVKIKDSIVTPSSTTGKPCDSMTITNLDKATRYIAFGKHDQHIEYDGVVKEPVESGKSLTITLNKTGDYLFHDHDDENVKGTFTVSE